MQNGSLKNWARSIPLLLLCAGIAAYHNSFSGPFIFDDSRHLLENEFRNSLWPIWKAFEPWSPRSFVAFTFSLNNAFSSDNVVGYHVVNLLTHLLAGCTLFGILRETLANDRLPKKYQRNADGLAESIALLWMVHPLQTQSVTYIIQRTESLMGLLYLAALYFFIRGAQNKNKIWYVFSVFACFLGMMTKQVIVTVPLMILVYDRLFIATSLKQVFRERGKLYFVFVLAWVFLGFLMFLESQRAVLITAGFQLHSMTPLQYAMTQPGVILHYLKLAVWPEPLILDYHWLIVRNFGAAILPSIVILLMVGATLWGLFKQKPWSYLGVWFFLILAPTSSFMPIADVAFEHRMYLPLAAVLALGVFILFELLRNPVVTFGVVFLAAGSLGFLTVKRNEDYSSSLSIWMDTVKKRPLNPRAHNNVGKFLLLDGQQDEAIGHFQKALSLYPQLATVHNNLGITYGEIGDEQKAVASFNRALEIDPDFADAHYNLGVVLNEMGRVKEAAEHLNIAIAAGHMLPKAHNNMGIALMKGGNIEAAITELEKALSYDPEFPDVFNNLGIAMMKLSKQKESLAYFERTLLIDPENAQAHNNLGILLIQAERIDEAIKHFESAAAAEPDYIDVHSNLGTLHAKQGHTEKAIQYYQHVLKLNPKHARTHSNLGAIFMSEGDFENSKTHLSEALQIDPTHEQAKKNMGHLLTQMNANE